MGSIGDVASGLEARGANFTVESLAKQVRQEWVEDALRETERESVRVRLLPATLTMWLVILMGLYRRTSYVNLLEKLHGTWWTRERWSSKKPPCSRAVTKARDRIGIEPMEILFKRSAAEWVAKTEGLVAEEGARPMVVTIPSRIKSFCGQFEGMLSEAKRPALSWILAAYLLATGKRTQSAVARGVLSRVRSPSSVSRRMRRERFRTRDLVRAATRKHIARELRRACGREEVWFLGIDGLATKRGGRTKIRNAHRCQKPRNSKGRSSKAHFFVMGLIVTASGARIPLPRRTYYTHKYISRENRLRRKGRRLVYKTQLDLACLIIKELELPENIKLVVVADEYFEGTKLTNLCRRKGYAFIAPVDSRRTFTPGKSLHARGKALARSAYRTLTLRQGEEDTASHRRHMPRGARKKDPRVYRYCCERRAVAKTGEVAVVYSWKRRRDRSGRLTSRETFKVLVCSDPTLFGERDAARIGAMIVEFYEMRWQVEVFFRELKSDLGLEDYQGCDFGAFERHVDLTMLSFMCLEDMRREEMARTRSPVKRREFARLRTRGLKHRLTLEAHAADVEWIMELASSRRGRGKAVRLLPNLKMPA